MHIEWEEQRTRGPVIHFCQSYPARYSGNKQILEVGTFFGAVTEPGCERFILYQNHETDVKYWKCEKQNKQSNKQFFVSCILQLLPMFIWYLSVFLPPSKDMNLGLR